MTSASTRGEARGRRRIPVTALGGIRPYDRAWLGRDIVAGVALAALAIPSSMGYTKIAGTPVVTGLYTMLLPFVAFALLGSSRRLVVGADGATAAILYAGIAGLGVSGLKPDTPEWVAYASLCALITAGFLLLARIARLGFLADFISRTVLVGFLTGVGVQIASGQLAGMLGVPEPDVDLSRLSGDLLSFVKTLGEIDQTSGATLAVSLAVLAVLLFLERWVTAVPAGLVAVVGAIAASWALDLSSHGVSTLGPVEQGLPSLALPSGLGLDDVPPLLATCGSLFLVILAQSAATARAYGVKYHEGVDANDDLVGLAAANAGAGVTGAFVVNGSPTKTAMADDAGSRTQVCQLAAAGVVALVLLFLTGPLQYLPNAVLATVVFLVGLKLVDIAALRRIRQVRRDEFWLASATAAVVVGVGVQQGILLAIVVSVLLHVRRHYAPRNAVVVWGDDDRRRLADPAPGTVSEPGLVVYRFGVGLFYANAGRFQEEILALVDVPDPPRLLVVAADAVDDIDYTGGQTLLEVVDHLSGRGVTVAIAGASEHVRRELDAYGVTDRIGRERYFDTLRAARDAFRAGG